MSKLRVVWLRNLNGNIVEHDTAIIPKFNNIAQWREAIVRAAKKVWNLAENNGWRIVQDESFVGFFAKREDGDVIVLK
jgi:hypothetical protein